MVRGEIEIEVKCQDSLSGSEIYKKLTQDDLVEPREFVVHVVRSPEDDIELWSRQLAIHGTGEQSTYICCQEGTYLRYYAHIFGLFLHPKSLFS